MQNIYVRPINGARIRDPDRDFQVLPADGSWVTKTQYWVVQLRDGSVEQVTPPTKAG